LEIMNRRSAQAPQVQHPALLLREFEACEAELPKEVYTLLRSRYAGQLDVTPTDNAGVYRLAARDYVGRISLPGGGMLVIQPKVGVANLFYMLCADASLAHFHPPPTGLEKNPDIFGFVIAALVKGVERLLIKGLYREYVPQERDLPFVRGRIVLGEQLRRHRDLKHHHVCAYADLTADTAENKVLAATLRYLPALLQPRGESELAKRVRCLLMRFEGVNAPGRGAAIGLLRTIRLHRLNAEYGPVLNLCRLALHHLTLDEKAGPHAFASFLVDMPRLFESFVTERLRALLPLYGLRVVAQRHDYLDEERRVGIRPDILVYRAQETEPALVLDAKYRRLDASESDLSRDLYQVSAYLDRYGLSRGILVYPQFERVEHAELKLRGTLKRLHLATLNLSAPNPQQLEQSCRQLATLVGQYAS
jgi:5-methylcytosine-specific restriction enzyme subunit McrC